MKERNRTLFVISGVLFLISGGIFAFNPIAGHIGIAILFFFVAVVEFVAAYKQK